MIFKIHKSEEKTIVAICDDELIDKKIEQDKLQLDLTSNFYKGEKKDPDTMISTLKQANIINAVGNITISFLIKHKLIDKEKIIKINKVPTVQIIQLS